MYSIILRSFNLTKTMERWKDMIPYFETQNFKIKEQIFCNYMVSTQWVNKKYCEIGPSKALRTVLVANRFHKSTMKM